MARKLTLGKVIILQLLSSLYLTYGDTATAASLPVIFPARRQYPQPHAAVVPDPDIGQYQRQHNVDQDLTARLRSVESSIALHHTGIKRQLEAIIHHLAAQQNPVDSENDVARQLKNIEVMVSSLSESMSERWQKAEENKRASIQQMQLTQSALRRQGRVLMGVKSVLQSQVQNKGVFSSELEMVRSDIHRVEKSLEDQNENFSSEINNLRGIVVSSFRKDASNCGNALQYIKNATGLIRSFEATLSKAQNDSYRSTKILTQKVESIANNISLFVNETRQHSKMAFENIRKYGSHEAETINSLLMQGTALMEAIKETSQNQTEHISAESEKIVSSHIASNILFDTRVNELTKRLTAITSSQEIQDTLLQIADSQTEEAARFMEVAKNIERLKELYNTQEFDLREILSNMSVTAKAHSEVSDMVKLVLKEVGELSEMQTQLNHSTSDWRSSSLDRTLGLLAAVREGFTNFSEAYSTTSTVADTTFRQLDSIKLVQNRSATKLDNLTLSVASAAQSLSLLSQRQHGLLSSMEGLQEMLRGLSREQNVISDTSGDMSGMLTQLIQSHEKLREFAVNTGRNISLIESGLAENSNDVFKNLTQQLSNIRANITYLALGVQEFTNDLRQEQDTMLSEISTIGKRSDVLVGHVLGKLREVTDELKMQENRTGKKLNQIEAKILALDANMSALNKHIFQVQAAVRNIEQNKRLLFSEILQQLDFLGVNANFTELQLLSFDSKLSRLQESTASVLSSLNERLNVLQSQIFEVSLQVTRGQEDIGKGEHDTEAALARIQDKLQLLNITINNTNLELLRLSNTLKLNQNSGSLSFQSLEQHLILLGEKVNLIGKRFENVVKRNISKNAGDKHYDEEETAHILEIPLSLDTPSQITNTSLPFTTSSAPGETIASQAIILHIDPTESTLQYTQPTSPKVPILFQSPTDRPILSAIPTGTTSFFVDPARASTVAGTNLETTSLPITQAPTTPSTPKKKKISLLEAFLLSLKKKHANKMSG